jgi:predicted ferric reductase
MDGPYGLHDFNFRRYPMMLLVGGGVGITPVMVEGLIFTIP